jgi:hypothetical protein
MEGEMERGGSPVVLGGDHRPSRPKKRFRVGTRSIRGVEKKVISMYIRATPTAYV